MTIRPAQPSDADAIRALTLQGAPGVSPFEPNELEWAFAHTTTFWVAEADVQVTGYLLGFRSNVPYDGEEFRQFQKIIDSFLYIDRIAVSPDARGQGLGRALYSQAIKFARTQRNLRLVCEVNLEPPNPQSFAFHKELGFVQVGTLDTRDGRKVALIVRNERGT